MSMTLLAKASALYMSAIITAGLFYSLTGGAGTETASLGNRPAAVSLP